MIQYHLIVSMEPNKQISYSRVIFEKLLAYLCANLPQTIANVTSNETCSPENSCYNAIETGATASAPF